MSFEDFVTLRRLSKSIYIRVVNDDQTVYVCFEGDKYVELLEITREDNELALIDTTDDEEAFKQMNEELIKAPDKIFAYVRGELVNKKRTRKTKKK